MVAYSSITAKFTKNIANLLDVYNEISRRLADLAELSGDLVCAGRPQFDIDFTVSHMIQSFPP